MLNLDGLIDLNGAEPETTNETLIIKKIQEHLADAAAHIAYLRSMPGEMKKYCYKMEVTCNLSDDGRVQVESILVGDQTEE